MKLFLLTTATLTFVFSFVGCGGVPPTFYYRVSHESMQVNGGSNNNSPAPVTLAIAPCTADILYESDKIVYRDSPYEVQFYHYRRWIASPKKIVTETILKQFRASGAFQRVVTLPASLEIDYILRGRILAFEEWDEGDSWFGIVSLEFQLQNPQTNEVVWENVFTSKTPAARKQPVEVVKAISESLYKVIDEAIVALKETLHKYKI